MVDLPAGLVQGISSLDLVSGVFTEVTIEKPHGNNDDAIIKVSLGLKMCRPGILYEYHRPKPLHQRLPAEQPL
jgi:hypothetical protein